MKELLLHTFVKDILHDEPSGHDYSHALRVLQNAKKLQDETMNHNIITASCLVHDLIDDKLEPMYQRSLEDIGSMLEQCHLTSTEISQVEDIIQTISFRGGRTPDSMEGKIVQDADRLDAIGAIGVARTFAYGGANHRKMYDLETINGDDTVSHFYQKLFHLEQLFNTKKAKRMATERTRFMKQFLSTLYYEINHVPSE